MDTIVGLIITIFVYLFVPICLVISGKKFKPSTIKKIVIINFLICWLGLSILTLATVNETAGGLIWGWVSYWVLDRCCLQDKQCAYCGVKMPAKATVCENCGCIDVSTVKDPHPKCSIGKTIGCIVASLFVLGSVALNFYLYAQIEQMQALRADDAKQISELTSKVDNLNELVEEFEEVDYWAFQLAELKVSQRKK